MLTLEQFAKRIDRFAKGFGKAIDEATFKAGQQLTADIKGRIFRVGGTKDTQGNTRGYKSESYKKKRTDNGLQVSRVDMVFTGDLQRSVRLFDSKNKAELKIVGTKNVDKARGNEELYPSKNVFIASDEEVKIAVEVFEESIADYIVKVFQ